MAFLESKCEYSDGERIPIRAATSRNVTADSPSRRAISHAASTISRRVASRRSARLSRLGKALIVRQYGDAEQPCQDNRRWLRPTPSRMRHADHPVRAWHGLPGQPGSWPTGCGGAAVTLGRHDDAALHSHEEGWDVNVGEGAGLGEGQGEAVRPAGVSPVERARVEVTRAV